MSSSVDPVRGDPRLAELSGPVRRYLVRLVGDPVLAEDLLQETLVKIARGLPGFGGRSSLLTWAFSVATHVVADHFRRPANRLRIVGLDESEDAVDDASVGELPVVVAEMNACIRQVIDSLPADYRTALVLHSFEGMTAARIAEVCGCSLATAKIRIHRATRRLKEALQKECRFYRDAADVLRCDRKPEEGTAGPPTGHRM